MALGHRPPAPGDHQPACQWLRPPWTSVSTGHVGHGRLSGFFTWRVVTCPPAVASIGYLLRLILPARCHRLSVCCWWPWGLLVLQVRAQEVRRAALQGTLCVPGGGTWVSVCHGSEV